MIPLPGTPKPEERLLETDILLLRRRIEALEERFHGKVYSSDTGNIVIPSSSTWVDVDFTGLTATLADFAVETAASTSSPLGLKNIGKKKRLVEVRGTFDAHSLGPNEEMAMRLVIQHADEVSPTAIPGCECHATGTASGAVAKLHSFGLAEVKPGTEIWMQAANFTNSGDISFERGRVMWNRVPGLY